LNEIRRSDWSKKPSEVSARTFRTPFLEIEQRPGR
jgi:hypothetical protein